MSSKETCKRGKSQEEADGRGRSKRTKKEEEEGENEHGTDSTEQEEEQRIPKENQKPNPRRLNKLQACVRLARLARRYGITDNEARKMVEEEKLSLQAFEDRYIPDLSLSAFDRLVVEVGMWRAGVVGAARRAWEKEGGGVDGSSFVPPPPRVPQASNNEGYVGRRVYRESQLQFGLVPSRKGGMLPKRGKHELCRLALALDFPEAFEWWEAYKKPNITEAEKLEALERFLQEFRKEPTNSDPGRVVRIVRSTGERIPINVTSFYDHACRGYKRGEELAKTLIETKIRPLVEKYVQKPNGRYAWQKEGLLLPDNTLEEALEIWKEDQRKYNAINLHEKAGRELKKSRPPTEYLVVLKSGQKVDIGSQLDTSLSVYPRMNQRWKKMKKKRQAIYKARFKLFCRVLELENDEQKYPPLGWAWWDAVTKTKSANPDGYADWLAICQKWKEHEPPQSYRLPLFTEVLKLREIDRCQSSEGGSFLTGKVPIGEWFFEEFLPVLPSDGNNKGYDLLDPIDRGYVDKIREVFFGADYWGNVKYSKRKAPNATLELLRGELSRWKPWNIMVYQRRGEDVQLWPSSAEKAFILDKGNLEGRVVNIGSMYNNLTRKTKPDDKNTKIREEIDSIVGIKIQWGRDPRPKKNESKNRKKVQKTKAHSITHEEYLLGFRKRFETLRGKGKNFKRIPSRHDKSTETYDIESPGNNKVIRISDKDLGNYARLVRDSRNLEQMRDIASSAKLEVDTKEYFEFFLGQQTPEDWKAAFEMRAKKLGPDCGYEAKVPKRMRNPAGSIKSYRIEKQGEFPFYRLFTENQLGQHVEWVIGQEKKEKKEGGKSSASDLEKWMGLTDDEKAEFKRRYSL